MCYVYLILSIFKIFGIHVTRLHLLYDVVFPLAFVSYHVDLAEGATTNRFNNFVNVHFKL
jgi:hypothetical protein